MRGNVKRQPASILETRNKTFFFNNSSEKKVWRSTVTAPHLPNRLRLCRSERKFCAEFEYVIVKFAPCTYATRGVLTRCPVNPVFSQKLTWQSISTRLCTPNTNMPADVPGVHRGVFVMVGKGISCPVQKMTLSRCCVKWTPGDRGKHDFIEILSFSGNPVDLMVQDLYPCNLYWLERKCHAPFKNTNTFEAGGCVSRLKLTAVVHVVSPPSQWHAKTQILDKSLFHTQPKITTQYAGLLLFIKNCQQTLLSSDSLSFQLLLVLQLLLVTHETDRLTGGGHQNWVFFRDALLSLPHFPILHLQANKSLSFSPNPNEEAFSAQQANTQPPTPLFCKTIGTWGFYSEAHIAQPVHWHHWPTRRGFLNQTRLPPSHMQVLIWVGKLIFHWFRICHCHVCVLNTRDVRRGDVMPTGQEEGVARLPRPPASSTNMSFTHSG